MRWSIVCLVLAFGGSPRVVLAQSDVRAQVAACAVVDDEQERLSCYGELIGPAAGDAQPGGGLDSSPVLGDLRVCAGREAPDGRLSCFDGIARRPAPGARAADGAEAWQVLDRADPDDGSRTVVLALPATLGRSASGDPVRLVLRCAGENASLYINWNEPLGNGGVDVRTQFGTAGAASRKWSGSTNPAIAFYPANAAFLIRELAKADHFAARVTPASGSPITAVFLLEGLAAAAVPLAEACGWADRLASEGPAGFWVEEGVDEPPVRLSTPRLEYPPALRDARIQGRVVAEVVIGLDGVPEADSFWVIESSGEAFAKSARDAILGSRFQPAHKDGQPVRMLVRQPIEFRILGR